MNNEIWYGIGAALSAGVISLIGYLYFQWQDQRSKANLRKQEAEDAQNIEKVRRLSDAELDALLKDGPGSGHPKT